jgi:hypothetical protein
MRMREIRVLIVFLLLPVHLTSVSLSQGAQPVHCTGRIVDVQGRPVAGAKVAAYEMVSDGVAGNIKLHKVEEVITQDDGTFDFQAEPRLERGTFLDGYIVATKQGLALGWAIWNMRENAEVMIELCQPEELEGVIVDEAGQHIAGAEVRANLLRTGKTITGEDKKEWLPGIAPIECLCTKTDDQGRFRFDNIPADSGVDLLIISAGRATTYTYDSGGPPNFKDGAGPRFRAGQTNIKVVLPAEGRIQGRIVDSSTGKAVQGIKLAVVPTFSPAFFVRFVCVSKEDGSFDIGGLQTGRYLIRGDFPELHVGVECGKIADQVTVECPGVVQGRVTGPGAEPIVGAEVQIREHNPGAGSIAAPDVETDEQGRYVYADIRWAYTIGVLYREHLPAGGYRFQYLRRNQIFDNSQTVDFQFEQFPAGTAAISGRVAGPDSKPLADFTVQLSNKVDWNDYSGGYLRQYAYRLSVSDVDGQFRIDDLPAGQYDIGAYKSDGTYTFPSREVALQERTITNVTFEPTTKVPAGSTALDKRAYYGRVLFDDGTPAAFDPGPWRRAKVHVDVLRGSGDVDDQGYFRADLTEKEFDSLVTEKATYGIYCPVPGEEGVSTQVASFPAKLLSPDKSQAGIVKIFKPIYKPRVEPVNAPSLNGRPLPTFDGITIKFDADQVENRAILLCFFDMNQRPSRHLVSELANRAEDLKGKGVTILAVQSSKIDERALVDWAKEYNIPFPVGIVQGDEDETRFAWGVRSLPWLILTNRSHAVTAEGFGLNELNDQIKKAAEAELSHSP